MIVDGRGTGGRDADAGAAERRLTEALGAQAALGGRSTAAPADLAPRSTGRPAGPRTGGASRGPHPARVTQGARSSTGGRPHPGGSPVTSPPLPSAGRRLRGSESAARLRRALLLGLLAGALLGCALAVLSVLDPGLLPALG
jgi:hypothetical protein